MVRKIVDYKKLTSDILDLLVEKYPYGYGDRDIIQFVKPDGKIVKTVEVRTEDTIYLVKISNNLEEAMDGHLEEEGDDDISTDIENNDSIEDIDIVDEGSDFSEG